MSLTGKHPFTYLVAGRQLKNAVSRFCGHYCVFYCLFKSLDYNMNAIDSCFSFDTGMNNVFVHAIVCRLI